MESDLDPELLRRFGVLHKQWRDSDEIRGCSNLDALAKHPAYRAIVAMGMDAVRVILARFQAGRIDHYFMALNEITNADPVKEQHQGVLDLMAQDWVEWGRANGLVKGMKQ